MDRSRLAIALVRGIAKYLENRYIVMAFVGNFSLEDVLILVGLWFLTSMVANLLWTRFVVLKYVGRALIDWLENLDQDPDGSKAVDHFLDRVMAWISRSGNIDKMLDHAINYLTSRQLATGKTVKTTVLNDDGKEEEREIPEVVTPLDVIGRSVARFATKQAVGALGGRGRKTIEAAQAIVEAGGNPDALLPLAATALQKGDYGPAIAYAIAKFKASQGNDVQKSTSVGRSGGGL